MGIGAVTVISMMEDRLTAPGVIEYAKTKILRMAESFSVGGFICDKKQNIW